ncbi:copper-(or silver)-translocating P-type ATPase [Methanobrevibacter gottschalkii]|uniref:Copper-(Or silver)-translocating P-type ATPase n=1 Tax=Methanobrevibacter gottschalkii TaxID=190974 RepID=A0A1H7LAM9_9EURY|nr:cation-translocating P-type ATPase [Methanobrevibacter gottschalkii]SEK95944.1 copper-(or silver)-translocating P-type ATPase [Methanobrevibacter gottschalkii]
MIDEITDFLFGLKMTIVSGIFLLIAVIFMIFGVNTPIYLNPAWGTVIISGIPMLTLAMSRLIREKWISSALLIAIAMVASLLIGEVFAAGEVAWIMALGAILEDWTVERAKKGLKNLINLTPRTGRRIINGNEEMIFVNEIKIGDILRILPGESVPVDGEIVRGTSSLDQSIMTGESLPIDKEVGDEVFCGTMNMYGAIDIKATSLDENSSLQKLIDLVKAADEKQAPTQRIADKWATWLVPVALIIAVVSWIVTGNIECGVTVLVVFCPCALILATPTAIMAAIGQATKYGVLIKSGEALETLGGLNTLVFDKTGTLTYGNLEVSDVISLNEHLTDEDLLKITASCEKLSEHPLAKAIVNNANEVKIQIEEPEEFKMYPGKGVTCINSYGRVYVGNSKFLSENNIHINIESQLDKLKYEGKASIIIALNGEVIGLIGLSDVVREDSKSMIEKLHDLGNETILLTGDNTETANYFAAKVGISKVYGNLLPHEKLDWIEKLKNDGKNVCMIGDGVNDAPALKTSDVGVAMGSVGSDVAIEAADIALLGDDIGKIPYLKKLSNSTLFTIKANIAISMTINAVAIVCSVLGLLNPVTGAIVHNAGSCLVVLNAALLYDRHFDDSVKIMDTESVEHSHYHFHNDGEHAHSHDHVQIINEIRTDNGIKHIHTHKHAFRRQICETYHS